MDAELKHFTDSIFTINPSFSDIFGSALPAMTGTSITTTGSDSSASVIVNELRQNTSQFAQKVTTKAPDEEVEAIANKIEGNLLNLQVLGQISEQFCNSLIEELRALTSQ